MSGTTVTPHVAYHFTTNSNDQEIQHLEIAVQLFERHVTDASERLRLFKYLEDRFLTVKFEIVRD